MIKTGFMANEVDDDLAYGAVSSKVSIGGNTGRAGAAAGVAECDAGAADTNRPPLAARIAIPATRRDRIKTPCP